MTSTPSPFSRADTWDSAYRATPPWDIGRPQPALREVAASGALRGRVLDVGCGTGEHVLMAASLGLEATGVDVSPAAIDIATRKAAQRAATNVRFVTGDMLAPQTVALLGDAYDTITDSGVFHVFSDDERPRYVATLRSLITTGGSYVMLCFSDEEPPGWGPRRVSQDEIRAAFAEGWRIESIQPVLMEVNGAPDRVRCWRVIATAT